MCVYMNSSPVIVFSSLPVLLPLKGALAWVNYVALLE